MYFVCFFIKLFDQTVFIYIIESKTVIKMAVSRIGQNMLTFSVDCHEYRLIYVTFRTGRHEALVRISCPTLNLI